MVSRDFDRDKRLLTARQFSAVFDSPTGKVPGKHVLLLARENGLDHPRLGLVIGKKNVKLAVQRNRLKRLIRESFRHNQETLTGWDIVVIARKGLGELENPELHQQFGKLWKRLLRNRPARKALLTPWRGRRYSCIGRCPRIPIPVVSSPFDDPAPSFPAKLYFPSVRGYRAAWPATQWSPECGFLHSAPSLATP